MSALPSICPVQRRTGVGQFPVRVFRSLNGKPNRRLYGNREYAIPLDLQFIVTSEEVEQVREAYRAAKGTFHPVELPDSFFDGGAVDPRPDKTLYAWRFAAEPVVEDLFPNRSRLSLRFEAG